MWLGLYIIAFSSSFIGHWGECIFDGKLEAAAACFWLLKMISSFSIPIITMAYGINLIINN